MRPVEKRGRHRPRVRPRQDAGARVTQRARVTQWELCGTHTTKGTGKSLEIVFVSSDHDDEAFASYPFASYHEEMAGAAVCKGLEADAR